MSLRLVYSAICVFTFLFQVNIYALEFKTEHDKGVWIKKYFKDKKDKKIFLNYVQDIQEIKKTVQYEVIQDFINQRNVQHIEPIAVGKSISDAEIAKYNTACPDKKPIDRYYEWWSLYGRCAHGGAEDTLPEEALEWMYNEEDKEIVYEGSRCLMAFRCRGNIKIYRLDVAQDGQKEQHIFYCDDLGAINLSGEFYNSEYIEYYYLLFNPKKCLYARPKNTFHHIQYKNTIHGIIKYKNQYYWYEFDISEPNNASIFIDFLHNPNRGEFVSARVIDGEKL